MYSSKNKTGVCRSGYLVGNKAKRRISIRVFQENNARQIFQKTYVCVSRGKKCLFFGKFGVLCLFETPVLRFALLSYYRPVMNSGEVTATGLWQINIKLFENKNNDYIKTMI